VKDDKQADEVRQRMKQLRSALVGDMDQISESARAMADWRYYVRRFPWASTAALAVAGYLIVPRRGSDGNVNTSALPEQVKENKFTGDRGPQATRHSSLLNSVVALVGAAAMRVATAYVSERVSSALRPHHADEEDVPKASRPR
jgi:hypothetical protein